MNANRHALVVGFCLAGFLAQDAAAYYHAPMGRFLSRDPAGQMHINRLTSGSSAAFQSGRRFIDRDYLTGSVELLDPMDQYADGLNLYQYVQSRPTIYFDPTGLNAECNAKANKSACKSCCAKKFGRGGSNARGCVNSCNANFKGCKTTVPWNIPDEANKRRGCTGNGSDHHCWAMCMVGASTGGVGGWPMWYWQDFGEYYISPSDDWACDILANEKGYHVSWGAFYHKGFDCADSYCDAACGTKKCR